MAIIQSEKLNLCGEGITQSLIASKFNNLGQFGEVILYPTLHFERQGNFTQIFTGDTYMNTLVKINGLLSLS